MNPEDTPAYGEPVGAVFATSATSSKLSGSTDSVGSGDDNDNGSTNSTTAGTETADNEDANEDGVLTPETIMRSFERIKTHFPAARIKKIMQSDDEIGKIAQATPVVVGRALEIFMANLVELAMLEARKQRVKRVGASHIRAAIEKNEQFDFLVDVVSKYPPLKE